MLRKAVSNELNNQKDYLDSSALQVNKFLLYQARKYRNYMYLPKEHLNLVMK